MDLASADLKFPGHLEIQDWGLIDYQEAWQKQKQLVELRQQNQIQDTLIFCQHPEVITLGRKSQRNPNELQLTNPKIPVLGIERGGEATYHGPGQIVLYPIVQFGIKGNLQSGSNRFGVVSLIRYLEQITISILQKEFSLPAGRVDHATGVWIAGERKIASIGIAVSRWVSYHGLALNLSTGREPWTWLNPCGFSSSVMTDLQMESGRLLDYSDAVALYLKTLK